MPERELITHNDYWEAKKQVERLEDAFERGMISDNSKLYLFQLKEMKTEFELKHPYHE